MARRRAEHKQFKLESSNPRIAVEAMFAEVCIILQEKLRVQYALPRHDDHSPPPVQLEASRTSRV